jgi:PPM family protein phosphatase
VSMITYEFFAHTDRGLCRSNNEDSVAIDHATSLAILADGMGGYNAGEVASSMATAFIQSEMGRWLAQAGVQANAREVRRALEICVDNANRAIFGAASANPQYAGMGTTLVVGVFQGERLTLGHIGDSRCYRLRGEEFAQVTRDHSWLQEQVDAGILTPEQAAVSPNRNLVTRALGVDDVALMDVNEIRVMPEDTFLMCSDGLSDMVSDEEIAQLLRTDESIEAQGRKLVDLANEHGGRDNISVLLVKAGEGPKKRGLMSRLLGA